MAREIATITGRIVDVRKVNEYNSSNGKGHVVNFTVVESPSYFSKEANEWKQGEAVFTNCVAFGNAALRLAKSLKKGDPVFFSATRQARDEFEIQSTGRHIPVSWEYVIQNGGLDLTLVEGSSDRDGELTSANGGTAKSSGGSRSNSGTSNNAPSTNEAPKKSAPSVSSDDVDDEDLPF